MGRTTAIEEPIYRPYPLGQECPLKGRRDDTTQGMLDNFDSGSLSFCVLMNTLRDNLVDLHVVLHFRFF